MALRILVVEDDKHTRRILESLLAKEPALADLAPEIVLTQDGREGLEALERGKVDLVISDLLMPRMDGFQFCRELRKHKHGQTVPLIVTSALYRDPAQLAKLQQETGAAFFSKPFQVRELITLVRKLLAPAAQAAGPAATATATAATATAATATAPAAPPPQVLARIEPVRGETGKLSERPPPRLLLDFSEQRSTGTLIFSRGKVRKDVSLVHGTPVFVSSNLRSETLGHFLVGRGLLDDERHQQALKKAQASHDRLGHALLELGWISEKDLVHELGAQMRMKLVGLLRWRDGDWAFRPGQPPADRVQTPVEAPRLIFTGLQKTARLDELTPALGKTRGRVGLTLRAERHREAFVRVFGAVGLEALARQPLVEDLVARADGAAMLVQLDALLECGMAELEPVTAEHDVTHPDAMPLSRMLSEPDAPAVDVPLQKGDLYDELFGDDISEVKAIPREPEREFDDEEPSAVTELPAAALSAPAAAPDPAVEALRKEILSACLALDGQDHYAVLGVEQRATAAEIAAAYAEVSKKFRLERFADVDLGPDYARLEALHTRLREAFDVLSSRSARGEYDRQLSDQKSGPRQLLLDAEVLATQAEQLLASGDATGARARLRDAVRAAPDQADYHALLGWASFVAEGGASDAANQLAVERAANAARPHLDQALQLDPEQLDAWEYSGRIAAAARDDERAAAHLERVLDGDPARAAALTALETVQARRGEWRRLERQYRKAIHRMRDPRFRDTVLLLWWRLAELYRVQLADRESARVAYEVAARMAPDDPRPRDMLARLHGDDPAAWDKTASALRDSFRLAPHDPEPGRALFKLHLDGQRWDGAFAAAAALVTRGLDDAPAGEFYRRYRPRFVVRAQAPIGLDLVDVLRHPDDDRDLAKLFALAFAPISAARPFRAADLGVGDGDRIDDAMLPEPFRRLLDYLCPLVGVARPPVYRKAELGSEAHVGAVEPPILLAGPRALAERDRLALGFRLGRALTYLWPGRAAAGGLPAKQLKITLLATVTLAQPGLKVDDPDGHIAQVRAQLAASPTLAREVAPIVERLMKNQSTLNLARFARGLARTADRIGLLVAGDLPTVARIVAGEAALGAQDDLVDFALSPEYLAARDALGLSVAV